MLVSSKRRQNLIAKTNQQKREENKGISPTAVGDQRLAAGPRQADVSLTTGIYISRKANDKLKLL